MNNCKINSVIQEMKKGVVKIIICKKHFFKSNTEEIQGTGFFFKKNYILTNYHIIKDAEYIKVGLYSQELWDAHVVGVDINVDICVLKVLNSVDSFLKINSYQIKEGDVVVTMGMPYGLEFTSSIGIISSLEHSLRLENNSVIDEVIQLDANLSPGNSGGPLVNLNNEVIGITTLSLLEGCNIAFAIKIEFVMDIVNNIIQCEENYE